MKTHATPCYIIAEAGVNHDSDLARALQLVDIAVAAKADAVKFQLFVPELLVTGLAPTAAYQAQNLRDDAISQRAMLEKLTLPKESMRKVAVHCAARGIAFLCTPFDHESLDYLTTSTPMPLLKLASGEVTNGPLLLAAARKGLPIILSTGMANLEEVGFALSVLHYGYTNAQGYPPSRMQPTSAMLRDLQGKVRLLHCVSQYPAPAHSTNLRAMDALRERFELPVGLSDHSVGITMSVAAVARGASVIEKHFTYNVHAPGPDHKASLTAEALAEMVRAIRDVEAGLGDGKKQCQPEEEGTRAVIRRSVVAAKAIQKGELFSEANLLCKRPASGPIPPYWLWNLLGKSAKRHYVPDDFIAADELE